LSLELGDIPGPASRNTAQHGVELDTALNHANMKRLKNRGGAIWDVVCTYVELVYHMTQLEGLVSRTMIVA